jgi:uncharacterized protein (DUF305 family)
MENKNNITAIVIVGIVGIFIGWLIWGHSAKPQVVQSTRGMAHMMPDGTMMGGNTDMSAMMANMNAGLQGKTGDAFDQEFIAEMIVHHQGAIDMAKLALTNAKHQEIKDLANAIISAQTKEITQMKQWQKSWYTQ